MIRIEQRYRDFTREDLLDEIEDIGDELHRLREQLERAEESVAALAWSNQIDPDAIKGIVESYRDAYRRAREGK